MNSRAIELEKLKAEIAGLHNAVDRLKEALARPNDPENIVRDSSIKRFEFCAELAWKTIKVFLSAVHQTECISPPTCLRAAFAKELIIDDPFWFTVYDMRNYAAHTYKESLAQKVYSALPESLARFEALLDALELGVKNTDSGA